MLRMYIARCALLRRVAPSRVSANSFSEFALVRLQRNRQSHRASHEALLRNSVASLTLAAVVDDKLPLGQLLRIAVVTASLPPTQPASASFYACSRPGRFALHSLTFTAYCGDRSLLLTRRCSSTYVNINSSNVARVVTLLSRYVAHGNDVAIARYFLC